MVAVGEAVVAEVVAGRRYYETERIQLVDAQLLLELARRQHVERHLHHVGSVQVIVVLDVGAVGLLDDDEELDDVVFVDKLVQLQLLEGVDHREGQEVLAAHLVADLEEAELELLEIGELGLVVPEPLDEVGVDGPLLLEHALGGRVLEPQVAAHLFVVVADALVVLDLEVGAPDLDHVDGVVALDLAADVGELVHPLEAHAESVLLLRVLLDGHQALPLARLRILHAVHVHELDDLVGRSKHLALVDFLEGVLGLLEVELVHLGHIALLLPAQQVLPQHLHELDDPVRGDAVMLQDELVEGDFSVVHQHLDQGLHRHFEADLLVGHALHDVAEFFELDEGVHLDGLNEFAHILLGHCPLLPYMSS
mmetsp:Transcript_16625/g.28334  ORF Transcript_16625/g.28334 Transcript_16625/m.28334 type:complete len:366 (-) Transcript_16625:427-1524(-)